MSNHFSPPHRPFLTQGDWGEGEKKARGERWEGKERKRLPIVPRALNAIFTGKPSGSLCIGERSNCYFQKNKNTNDNDTRILSSERRKLLPVSKQFTSKTRLRADKDTTEKHGASKRACLTALAIHVESSLRESRIPKTNFVLIERF